MVIAQTMNGTVKTYKGSRPSFIKQSVSSFVNNSTNMNLFVSFFEDHAGKEITFAYYRDGALVESVAGFIITPAIEIVTEGDTCNYSVDFEFEYTTFSSDYFMPDVVCP